MEKLIRWDMKEFSRRERFAHAKRREELNKVNWEMIKKDLHTPEALQAYQELRKQACGNIDDRVTGRISQTQRKPDVRYVHRPSKERMLLEWGDGMKELQKRYPLGMKLLQKILPVSKKSRVLAAVGLSACAVAGLGGRIWLGNTNEQENEAEQDVYF
ncbi:hypothetical protein RHSIM_Rhsim01G0013200 [Rhododendron simsii]|uniref:Uncharacterized protein n=1 Tax=Rhododendron simsii TaxID=118357 RepID=A0A834HDI7_RHOSS|nr:hypothetical protein RHSIM_Rhsim01G0013200 [Rhododendron simsii]